MLSVLLAALFGGLIGAYLWRVAYCYQHVALDAPADTAPNAQWLAQAAARALHHKPSGKGTYLAAALLAGIYTLLYIQGSAHGLLYTLGLAWAASVLVLLAYIDAQTRLLPDALTLPLLWTGLAWAWLGLGAVCVHAALLATMTAYSALWLLAWGFSRLRGQDGLGGGDIKLLAAIGAWGGFPDVFWVLLCASLTGLLYALIRRHHLATAYPFGPHLVAAALGLLILQALGIRVQAFC